MKNIIVLFAIVLTCSCGVNAQVYTPTKAVKDTVSKSSKEYQCTGHTQKVDKATGFYIRCKNKVSTPTGRCHYHVNQK